MFSIICYWQKMVSRQVHNMLYWPPVHSLAAYTSVWPKNKGWSAVLWVDHYGLVKNFYLPRKYWFQLLTILFPVFMTKKWCTFGDCTVGWCSCIKPNAAKLSSSFSAELVLQQLRYTGVLETVKIRKQGYPTRLTFVDFMQRYGDVRILWFCVHRILHRIGHLAQN